MTINMNTGDLVIPSMMFLSSFNFLAFKKLKTCIITKQLKMKVKCLDGVTVWMMDLEYSDVDPSRE